MFILIKIECMGIESGIFSLMRCAELQTKAKYSREEIF